MERELLDLLRKSEGKDRIWESKCEGIDKTVRDILTSDYPVAFKDEVYALWKDAWATWDDFTTSTAELRQEIREMYGSTR